MNMKLIALAGAAAASLALAACERQAAHIAPPAAALPLAEIATGPLPLAPPLEALPPAPPPRLGRITAPRMHYGYLDRGYEISDAFYDSPPDYAFDYDEAEPWVWRSEDDYYLVSEPFDEGWRYYYYEPGGYQPFLVRDPYYSYGFDRGALVVVYDSAGRVLPDDLIPQRADYAGRYLSRGELLYRAAVSQPRQAVAVTQWATERPDFEADRLRLAQQEQALPAWRAYRQSREAKDGAHWADERRRRQAWAARADEQLSRQTASIQTAPVARDRTAMIRPTAPPLAVLEGRRSAERVQLEQKQAKRTQASAQERPRIEARGQQQARETQRAQAQAQRAERAAFEQRARSEAHGRQVYEAARAAAQAERSQRAERTAVEQRLGVEARGRQAHEAERAQANAQRAMREQARAQASQQRAAAQAARASQAQAQVLQAQAQAREQARAARAAARHGVPAAAQVAAPETPKQQPAPAQGGGGNKGKHGKGAD